MNIEKTLKRVNFLVNSIYFIFIIICIYFFIKYMLFWLSPIIFGIFIAVSTKAILRKNRITIKNNSFGLFYILIFWAIIFTCLFFVIWAAVFQLSNFLKNSPNLLDDISISANSLRDRIFFLFPSLSKFQINNFINYESIFKILGESISNIICFLPKLIFLLIISILCSFFIFIEYDKISTFLREKSIFFTFKKLKTAAFSTLIRYITAQTIMFCIVFLFLAASLFLLKVDSFIVIAFIISFGDFLPLLGINLITGVWGVSQILLGNVYFGIAIVLVGILIFLLKEFLEPKIMGEKLGVSPLVIILGAYLGLVILGPLGAICSPFIVSLVFIYFKEKKLNF